MKCTHGATTPWVSVDKETPQDPSPNPRRWLAWMELLFSKSQRGHPTALPGLLCPETGDLEEFTVPLNSELSVPNSKTYRCLQGSRQLSFSKGTRQKQFENHLFNGNVKLTRSGNKSYEKHDFKSQAAVVTVGKHFLSKIVL